ncbi:DUF402 domain-containing protein [Halegenticoccus tardaugens]|uniref:DUF402 domain-containing protein n=1 Tax=Halegenticoccus tardaugens TaxID=2071624 RepID=UPI00100BFAB5|nr:DUF402 domain-containing protein [Halegenticoccus tardaugens]
MRVRVRGIYATALTRLFLDAGHEVVQASPSIRRRFDADLPAANHDVAVETTRDRQGVGVEGRPDAVETATDLLGDVGIDAFVWTDSTPTGAVFDGRVTETFGGGAAVDLGEESGYIPYDNADDYVETGDSVRVQVAEATSPWDDDRPLLDGEIRATDGLATLVRGREGTTVETRDDAAGRELVGMTELLGADAPDGWGVRWHRAATEAGMDALSDALARASDRAKEIDAALESKRGGADGPTRLVSGTATAWAWFGRESRFSLDARRRDVTTTIHGHHRIKAAHEAASAGVDLAEALCETASGSEKGSDFPFGVATDQFGPAEGDAVRIGHGKPDGRLVVLGEGSVVGRNPDGTISVRREMSPGGTYDALGVEREAGDVALTKFREGRWWYPTVYRDAEGERKGTYVNVCTPVECFPDEIRYVDLHVDVVKHADGTVERVDDDELDDAVEDGDVSEPLAEKARAVAGAVERAL